MKTNNIKSAMEERVASARWSEADTFHVLQKITEEEPAVAKRRMPAALSAALVLVLLLAVTALAESQWGLLHWFSGEKPKEAVVTVKPEIIYKATCDLADFELTEASSDGYALYVNMRIIPKKPDTLFMNLYPNKPVSRIGVKTDDPIKTIGDWAEEQGYTHMYYIDCGTGRSVDGDLTQPFLPGSFDSDDNSVMQINEDGSFNLLLSGVDLGPGHKYRVYCSFMPLSHIKEMFGDNNEYSPFYDHPDRIYNEESDSRCYTSFRFSVPEDKMQDSRVIARYLPAEVPEGDYLEIKEMNIVTTPLSSYCITRYALTEKGLKYKDLFYNPPEFNCGEHTTHPSINFHESPSAKGEMYGWRQLSNGENPEYEYFYSLSLPEEFPDQITLQTWYYKREDLLKYEHVWCPEETEMKLASE